GSDALDFYHRASAQSRLPDAAAIRPDIGECHFAESAFGHGIGFVLALNRGGDPSTLGCVKCLPGCRRSGSGSPHQLRLVTYAGSADNFLLLCGVPASHLEVWHLTEGGEAWPEIE